MKPFDFTDKGRTTYSNGTKYEPLDVIKVVRRAARAEIDFHKLRVDIVSTRSNRPPQVRCIRREYNLQVWVALPRKGMPTDQVRVLAMKVRHLLDTFSAKWWTKNPDVVTGLKIRKKPTPPKLTRDQRSEQREAHARKMLARAEADADKVNARLEKWGKRVDYYDRKHNRQEKT